MLEDHSGLTHLYVVVTYTNWRGITAERLVRPLEQHFEYKSTFHHPVDQWFIHVFDPSRDEYRIFAMKDISSWRPATEEDFKARGSTC